MTTMKAARITAWGTPAVVEDVPLPVPADDEALIRVEAASLNPLDSAVAAGYLAFMLQVPMTLGSDYSGVVVEVGKDVTHVKPGDHVYGFIYFRGSISEYVVAKANEIALKPASLDHTQAAAVPLPAMAAWQSLFDHGGFKDGERVLIHGVGGSVGKVAAQLAKARGAYVYGTDFGAKKEHAEGPVDRFIDTESEKFEDIVDGVDVVLDYVGGEMLQRSYSVLGEGGRYVTTMQVETPQDEPSQRGFSSVGFGAVPRADLLDEVAKLVDSGVVSVTVHRTFPIGETQAALDYRYMNRQPGKIVIAVA